MPRRKIQNENDAAKLLADAAVKVANGKMPAHSLHAITSALTAYGHLRKLRNDTVRQKRDDQRRERLSKEIDEILFDSPGARAYAHKHLLPARKR